MQTNRLVGRDSSAFYLLSQRVCAHINYQVHHEGDCNEAI